MYLTSRLTSTLVIFIALGFVSTTIALKPGAAYPAKGPLPSLAQDRVGGAVPSLESLLNPDGTLNLQTGFSGSLDPSGWRMVSEPGKPPRFARSSELGEDKRGSVLQGPVAVPGDENWDDRFNLPGMNFAVFAIAVSGSDVYVGGGFTRAVKVTANHIAKWDSVTGAWSALGSGVSGGSGFTEVRAIVVSGSDVYVGGRFSAAGGISANNIAIWNSATGDWSALGSGVSGPVHAIAVSGGVVYAGGDFATAGVVSTKNIAKWSGAWSALTDGVTMADGVNGRVFAIEVSGSDVYVGGYSLQQAGEARTVSLSGIV